ncbi:MAG: helix-turn-helix domain-containing protein [Umezawaea sp.]
MAPSRALRLVLAGRRPAGVYTIAEVLVEHAVTTNDRITAQLVEIIRPLRDHPVLWQTLVALLDADFSRNQATRNLFVHRSTLDYRLRRIAKVTGYDQQRSWRAGAERRSDRRRRGVSRSP